MSKRIYRPGTTLSRPSAGWLFFAKSSLDVSFIHEKLSHKSLKSILGTKMMGLWVLFYKKQIIYSKLGDSNLFLNRGVFINHILHIHFGPIVCLLIYFLTLKKCLKIDNKSACHTFINHKV